ncbi:uncharacterized protein TRUGW13939_00928 [Talaromyces rugulosus]|uniref:MARVEL domain-containing protein n=1 Tax=Talaromyces rugulosus TaxID=121627 RepID=A0A7H8QIR5_TALRU|nr:uncharacterized protein TRUGW13939_00928 [Talaromyces rugulosus]QKX53848.1 hypothetical protein TRUGW13939_00928 [Talaromyces rugulosus]
MGQLVKNMPRHDIQWRKLKSDYMYNNTYYLRKKKFIVYQFATNITGAVNSIGIAVLKPYNEVRSRTISDFPSARINSTDLVASLGFNIAPNILIGLFFGAAIFYDLFWPERVESRRIQWTWQLSAVVLCAMELAALLWLTVTAATHGIQIDGVTDDQANSIRQSWHGPSLDYCNDGRAVAAIIVEWIGFVFTVWSTILMMKAYSHNNKYGPFADHITRPDGEHVMLDVQQDPA